MRTYIGTLIAGLTLMYIFVKTITLLHIKMLCFALYSGQYKKTTTVYMALNIYHPEQYMIDRLIDEDLNYTNQLLSIV